MQEKPLHPMGLYNFPQNPIFGIFIRFIFIGYKPKYMWNSHLTNFATKLLSEQISEKVVFHFFIEVHLQSTAVIVFVRIVHQNNPLKQFKNFESFFVDDQFIDC